MKITEYPNIEVLDDSNVLLVDGDSGTKTIKTTDAILAMLHNVSAKTHRMIFRGKNLGSSVTTEQLAAIQDGTFKDLWLGDYWVINGVTWRIMDFDYWLNCGDTAFTKHHVVVMPDRCLYNSQMNASNVTTGGYVGSAMYTSNLANAKTIVNSAFGSHALSHREYFTNAVSNGKPSGGAWVDSVVDLPNEIQMYGHLHFSPTSDGSTIPSIHTIDKTQFALFMVAPEFITNNNKDNQWLRDVVSATSFALVGGYTNTFYSAAPLSNGVRPPVAVG